MDSAILVGNDIDLGRRALEALDEDHVPVSAFFWFRDPERAGWRLVVASKIVSDSGPRKLYESIQRSLTRHDLLDDLPLQRFSVTTTRHPVVQVLGGAFRTPRKAIASIDLQDCVINGVPIDGAHIYRMAPPRSRRTR